MNNNALNEIDILDENFQFINDAPVRVPGGIVLDRYRCPRETKYEESRVLSLTQAGDRFDMMGGKYGTHSITEPAGPKQRARVIAHWEGYIAATRYAGLDRIDRANSPRIRRSVKIQGAN